MKSIMTVTPYHNSVPKGSNILILGRRRSGRTSLLIELLEKNLHLLEGDVTLFTYTTMEVAKYPVTPVVVREYDAQTLSRIYNKEKHQLVIFDEHTHNYDNCIVHLMQKPNCTVVVIGEFAEAMWFRMRDMFDIIAVTKFHALEFQYQFFRFFNVNKWLTQEQFGHLYESLPQAGSAIIVDNGVFTSSINSSTMAIESVKKPAKSWWSYFSFF